GTVQATVPTVPSPPIGGTVEQGTVSTTTHHHRPHGDRRAAEPCGGPQEGPHRPPHGPRGFSSGPLSVCGPVGALSGPHGRPVGGSGDAVACRRPGSRARRAAPSRPLRGDPGQMPVPDGS